MRDPPIQTPDTILNTRNVSKFGEIADNVIDRNNIVLVVIAAGFLPNLRVLNVTLEKYQNFQRMKGIDCIVDCK